MESPIGVLLVVSNFVVVVVVVVVIYQSKLFITFGMYFESVLI